MDTPGFYPTTASVLYFGEVICYTVSLRAATQFPIAFQLTQNWTYWFLKYPELSSADCKNPQS